MTDSTSDCCRQSTPRTSVHARLDGDSTAINMEKAADAVADKAEDALHKLKSYVQFGTAPEVLLRIRKQFRLGIPIAPDVVITAGTDVPLQKENDGNSFGREVFSYKPNLQWKVTDSWFNGDINVDTRKSTIYYEKCFDFDPLTLKLSGNFDYEEKEPYIGFQFLTTSGVTSPSTENGFSVRKSVQLTENESMALSTDFEASLKLGATTMGTKSKKMKTSPATVDFHKIVFDLFIK